MNTYSLEADEVVLYQGNVQKDKLNGEIVLTNNRIIFAAKKLRLFKKSEDILMTFLLDDIKIYNNEPQIKNNGLNIEVYMLSEIITFTFLSRMEIMKFSNAIKKHFSGQTIVERGSEKVKDAIKLVNDTLGINTIETVKDVVENGVLGGAKGILGIKHGQKIKSPNTFFEKASSITKELMHNGIANNNTLNSNEDVASTINQLKNLLDNGAITQEEFDKKKSELLSRL